MKKSSCAYIIWIIFFSLSFLAPKGHLTWSKLRQLYTYKGGELSKCWKDQLISFTEISSTGGHGAGSSADRNYQLCLDEKGFFLKQDTLGNEQEPGIMIPWSDMYVEVVDRIFPFYFSPNKIPGTRFEVSPEDYKTCLQIRDIIKNKVANQQSIKYACD